MKKVHRLVVGAIATNCWIYPLENGTCAVIDPGEEGLRILDFLDHNDLFPAYILLTHGHFDHIGALPALMAKYTKRHIAIHAADAEYLGPAAYPVHSRSFSMAAGNSAYLDALWEEMPSPDSTLAEGDTIGPFTVLHLPGHTPGSIGLWDKDAGILFTGDTLFDGDYGRTDLPGGNEELIFASLKRLFSMDGNIQVYPGHGDITTIKAAAAHPNLQVW